MAEYSSPRGAPGTRTEVSCSKCGKTTTVPFAPTPGRPVYCRECFAQKPAPSSGGGGQVQQAAPRGGGGFRGPPRGGPAAGGTTRQRMMAQGRKGHFIHDARAIFGRTEGGMEDQYVRAFLEGLFARGARTSTRAAQEFLDEKLADNTITPQQRAALGDLVERYSFWR